MLNIETLIAFISTSFFLCLLPGPDNIFVLSQSAVNGRKTGISITIGLCIGLLIHTSLVSLGIAAILRESIVALEIIRALGVCYLSHLAWKAFNAKPIVFQGHTRDSYDTKVLIKKGLIMNLSNPKIIIFFMAFLPQFTTNSTSSTPASLQLFYLGLTFVIISFILFTLISYLSGFLNTAISSRPSIQTILNKITGLILIALAINLFVSHF